MRLKSANLLLLSLLTLGCQRDEPALDPAPILVSVQPIPSSVTQYTEPLLLRIHYRDNDGDLGENTAGVNNCFVVDNRIGIRYEYRIPQLAPSGSTIAIEGDVDIDLGGQGILDSLALEEQVTFTVTVVDRAGHVSQAVTTPNIRISRQ